MGKRKSPRRRKGSTATSNEELTTKSQRREAVLVLQMCFVISCLRGSNYSFVQIIFPYVKRVHHGKKKPHRRQQASQRARQSHSRQDCESRRHRRDVRVQE